MTRRLIWTPRGGRCRPTTPGVGPAGRGPVGPAAADAGEARRAAGTREPVPGQAPARPEAAPGQGAAGAPVVWAGVTDRLTTCGAGERPGTERSPRNGVSAYTASEAAAITIRAMRDSTIRARRDLISAARPGRPNEVSLDASRGSSSASLRSISSRMRCSSIDTAMATSEPPSHRTTEPRTAPPAAPGPQGSHPYYPPPDELLPPLCHWTTDVLVPGGKHLDSSGASATRQPRWVEKLFDSAAPLFYDDRMRWDSLRLDGSQADQPGGTNQAPTLFERDAVARTFDTPGFRGMTFYEVHARSIINQVPPASRIAFRWTINPYRGCSHACSYCSWGGTPILMADGRTRPLAEVKVGDQIYGTERRGSYRHYVVTEVLAHWSTIKSAYRVTLEDSTRLFCSSDHRFLTGRGWKYVIGTERSGPLQRPHLTVNNEMLGVGSFAEPPKESYDYQRGYLCGMIRGDANLATYTYERPGRAPAEAHRFRLALADKEALDRTRDYLDRADIRTTEFLFAEATSTRRQMMAIRATIPDQVRVIKGFIGWPNSPTLDWRKGFLAGIFDAEGGYNQGVWRVSNTDPEIIGWTVSSMKSLGFAVATAELHPPNG